MINIQILHAENKSVNLVYYSIKLILTRFHK